MNNSKQVLWFQVCGLGMVQGAITLSWVIYNFYLPKLFVQFGFSKSLAVTLLILENILAVIMEPLMGSLSDKKQRWVASRFPFIMVGVLLSSALFIAIPSVVTFVPATTVFKFILPPLVVAWALAMTVFRSPVLSLLGRYAMPASLPMAASVLTLIGGIVGSFKFAADKLLLGLNPIITFTFGSFVLLGSAFILKSIHPPEVVSSEPVDKHQAQSPLPISIPALASIFILGSSFAWGYRSLLTGVSKFIKLELNIDNVQLQMIGFGLLAAFAALPAGAIAKKLGNRKAMAAGTAGVIVFMLLLSLVGANLLILVPLGISMSFVLNGTIPFAIEMSPPNRGGLGIGMYFGGIGLAMAIFSSLFNQPKAITPQLAAVMSAIAFSLALGCVISSNLIQQKNKI
ncbi:MAG: MFS transporter [Rivularia sp. ALOHA_DT_140]|nr:MFS transporter [Rivularia sp. ALOHA_DT_140]